jgi:hypothetical protein
VFAVGKFAVTEVKHDAGKIKPAPFAGQALEAIKF